MNIDYKTATEKDIDSLLLMMSEFYKHEQIQFNNEILKSTIIDLIQNPFLGKIWLINVNSQVVGYFVLTYIFSLEYGGRNALLDEIFIKKDFRGKGIGSKTLNFIEQQCKIDNIHVVHLQVKKFNPSAKKLYELNGYREVDRTFMIKLID